MDLEEKLLRSAAESKKHYTTPDNYFEEISQRVMATIEKEDALSSVSAGEPISSTTLWVRLRPYLGLAAAFLLTIGIFRLFNYTRESIMEQRTQQNEEMMAKELSSEPISEQDYYEFLTSEYAEDFENNWLETSLYSH